MLIKEYWVQVINQQIYVYLHLTIVISITIAVFFFTIAQSMPNLYSSISTMGTEIDNSC